MNLFLIKNVFAQAPTVPPNIIPVLPSAPLTKLTATKTPISVFMNWTIGIFWVVAVGMVIWAAFLFLTAGGDEDKVREAKMRLKYALIAGAVALVSTGIDILVNALLSGTFT